MALRPRSPAQPRCAITCKWPAGESGYYDHCAFVDFHGLSLCDGCADRARRELYDIQRPLIEALAAEPTLDRAGALGFELTRDDGRLVWIGEDDDFDGGKQPYADEREALEMLAEELTSYL